MPLIHFSGLKMFRGSLLRTLMRLYFDLPSLNWRNSNSTRCLMEISDPQVVHSSSSDFSMRCLGVFQICLILKRDSTTYCSLVKFSGLFHLSVVCLISFNLSSLSWCHSLRRKSVTVFLDSLLIFSWFLFVLNSRVSIAWPLTHNNW